MLESEAAGLGLVEEAGKFGVLKEQFKKLNFAGSDVEGVIPPLDIDADGR